MATITLEKDLLRKVSRLGLDVSKKPRISVFSDEEIVSLVNFLLSRYDAAWFWETENFSLQENRKRCLRYLRLLDVAHFISGPTELTPGNRRILRLLCALFEKLERKHGSTLYQKPRQVLKPRPRRSPVTVTPQDAGGIVQSEKENHSRTRSTSQRKPSIPISSSNSTPHAVSIQSSGALPRTPPHSQRNAATPVLGQTAVAPTGTQPLVESFAPRDDSPTRVSTPPRSSSVGDHPATREPTPSELSSCSQATTAAAIHRILPSTELMLTLQAQINNLQSNIAKTSHQHDALRLQQSRLSDNLQRMWAHYEFNLRLLRDLSRTDTQSAPGFSLPGVSSSRPPSSTATAADPPSHAAMLRYMQLLQQAVSVESVDGAGPVDASPLVHHSNRASSAPAGDVQQHGVCSGRSGQRTDDAAGLLLGAAAPGLGDDAPEVFGRPRSGVPSAAAPAPPLPTSTGDHRNTVPPFAPAHPAATVPTLLPAAGREAGGVRRAPTPAAAGLGATSLQQAPAPARPDIDYLERRLQRVLRRSELFLERDRLMQARTVSLEL